MKQYSPILNIILLVLVVILYVLHFTDGSKKTEAVAESTSSDGIYYVNIDSLNNNLKFLVDKQEELEMKEIEADVSLKKKGAELEKEIMDYQKQVQGGFLTPKQMQTIEQRLGRKQQELMAERDSMSALLLLQSQQINLQVTSKLRKYIDEFKNNNEVNLVMGYSEGGNILYANEGMDITKQILEKMNSDKEE